VLKTLITKAIHNYAQFFEKEKSHLTKALISNGYSLFQINKTFRLARVPKSKNSSILKNILLTPPTIVSPSQLLSNSLLNPSTLFFFTEPKILTSAPYYSSSIIHQAVEIEKHPDNFNREDDYKLSQSWKSFPWSVAPPPAFVTSRFL
jgi:hypothetical protein